jgi:hypothetical protein
MQLLPGNTSPLCPHEAISTGRVGVFLCKRQVCPVFFNFRGNPQSPAEPRNHLSHHQRAHERPCCHKADREELHSELCCKDSSHLGATIQW